MWKQYIKILIAVLLLFNTTVLVTADFQSSEYAIPTLSLPQTVVYVDPQNVSASVGENVTISVKVANVIDLYGVDIQFNWDPTLLKHVSHTKKIPVETYPDGIMHSQTIPVKDDVDETGGLVDLGAEPGTLYWLAEASMYPAEPFDGSGIAFEMTFTVLRTAACYLHFTSIILSNSTGFSIPHEAKDGNFWSTPEQSFAPIANFTFSPDTAFWNRTIVTINASDSYDPDGGDITLYIWDFGDGTSENTTDPIVTHIFQKRPYCDVTLTVIDDEDSLSIPLTKKIPVKIYHDISITSVTIPPQMPCGLPVTINVTVSNLGDAKETSIKIGTYYNETTVDPTNITATQWVKIDEEIIPALEPAAELKLTFSWDTKDVTPEVYYYIMANATELLDEADVTNNVMLSDTLIYIILANPIVYFTHSPAIPIVNEEVIFDASASYDPDGNIISYIWDFGDGTSDNVTEPVITHAYTAPGNYNVTLTATDNSGLTNSTTRYVGIATYHPIDITIDAGAVYFSGETAEFYILTLRSGERINVSKITAILYFNGEKIREFQYPTSIKPVGTGIYRVPFTIPKDALSDTYTLIVEATVKAGYLNLKGTNLKSFYISSTLTGWNGLLISINGTVGTIKTDVGLVQIKLDNINATLVDIQGTLGIINSTVGTFEVKLDNINATLAGLIVNAKGEILAKIDTALGTITTKLDNINATVNEVNGNVITIDTTLGEVQDTAGAIQSTATIGLALACILSLIAAIAAIILIKKKPSVPT